MKDEGSDRECASDGVGKKHPKLTTHATHCAHIPKEGDNVFFQFDPGIIDENKRQHFEFWFINLGLLSCYVVCGLIIAALGASIQDVAQNVNRKSTDIASIFVARGVGSIFGSFISAPIFTVFNAIKSLMLSYAVTVAVLLWIPLISTLSQLHISYFLIGALTSIISSGSILLLRKIHKDRAGPWLGALGAALVSAGMIVPCVQMLVGSMMAQFCMYSAIIVVFALWLRVLPNMREDVYSGERETPGMIGRLSDVVLGYRGSPDLTLSPRMSGRTRASPTRKPTSQQYQSMQQEPMMRAPSSVLRDEKEADSPFFMTTVACSSTCSSSSFYTSALNDLSKFTKSQQDLAALSQTEQQFHSAGESSGISNKRNSHVKNYHSLESGLDSTDREVDELTQEEEDFLLEVVLAPDPPHYWSDLTISLMIMFIIGGSNAFSIYIETYVDDTGVIASQWKAMVLMLFFGAGTFGNVVGIIIQMDIGDRLLLVVTATVLVGGAVGMMLIIGLPQDANALWTGVALYGFASAVTVGFCFNIANRLAYPSAKSTSIIMMGSSIGVSLIPYLASLIYKITHSPLTMMYIGLASMVIPVMLLFIAPRVSYLSHTHKF